MLRSLTTDTWPGLCGFEFTISLWTYYEPERCEIVQVKGFLVRPETRAEKILNGFL